jgi:hypothetical protein
MDVMLKVAMKNNEMEIMNPFQQQIVLLNIKLFIFRRNIL